MTTSPTLPGPAICSLLRVNAARLLRFAETVSHRDFQGETFESTHIAGDMRRIATDLLDLIADVAALEKRP